MHKRSYCDSTGPPPPPAKKDKKKKPRSLLIRFKKLLTKKDFDSKKNAILSKLQKLLDISLDRIILALESTGLPAGARTKPPCAGDAPQKTSPQCFV